MKLRSGIVATAVTAAAFAVLPMTQAHAATNTLTFAGTTTTTMTVNDGVTSGSLPAGTPYTGTLTFDAAQTAASTSFNGGTQTLYSFTNLAFTVGSSTANSGPGQIMVNNNLTSTVGYPSGDSVYVNFSGVAPTGLLSGLSFNWMGLAFLDPSGAAVTAGSLPDLGSGAFTTKFSEFNFGTLGTKWGAGNTSTIQSLSTVNGNSTPAPITFTPSLPGATVGTYYSASFAAATGGTGSFTYSASGLPAGLSLSGTTVSGTPTAAGTYDVTLTATDSSGLASSATLTIAVADAPVACAGSNGVISSYVARSPGYIVVNGGLNLLDHLWTTNLNASNTTFNGGLVNWYQTGLIVSWTGTSDPAGCILDHLTVSPAVMVATTTLPNATTGVAYAAPVAAAWGVAPYQVSVSGLPSGLSFDGSNITGTPTTAGTYSLTVSVVDAVGATASSALSLTVAQGGNYTIVDESKGKITAIAPDYSYLMVGTKKLMWNSSTLIIVNTPSGTRSTIDSFVKVGMRVQWKGLRDKATNTVMTKQLEVN